MSDMAYGGPRPMTVGGKVYSAGEMALDRSIGDPTADVLFADETAAKIADQINRLAAIRQIPDMVDCKSEQIRALVLQRLSPSLQAIMRDRLVSCR